MILTHVGDDADVGTNDHLLAHGLVLRLQRHALDDEGAYVTVFVSDTECIFKVRRDFMPHPYHEGVFLAVLRALGCKDVKVRGQKLGLMDADYFISWR